MNFYNSILYHNYMQLIITGKLQKKYCYIITAFIFLLKKFIFSEK